MEQRETAVRRAYREMIEKLFEGYTTGSIQDEDGEIFRVQLDWFTCLDFFYSYRDEYHVMVNVRQPYWRGELQAQVIEVRSVYRGRVPMTESGDVDVATMTVILRNWKCFIH